MKNYKPEQLRPLPMRITQLQYGRLLAARKRSGISVQEHVRRGLDFYLVHNERDHDARLDAVLAELAELAAEKPILDDEARLIKLLGIVYPAGTYKPVARAA